MSEAAIEEIWPCGGRTQSRPMEFAELSVGEYFIAFPLDGDDGGHGGFRGSANVFRKVSDEDRISDLELAQNSVCIAHRSSNGRVITTHSPPTMQVLRVSVDPYLAAVQAANPNYEAPA